MDVDNGRGHAEATKDPKTANGDVAHTNGAQPADAPDLSIKHPLQHKWTMWYDCAQKKVGQSAWGDQLRKIVTIDTVEDFWGLYNNIVKASKLQQGANYHLFKEGVEPKWEDPENDKGGKWIITMPSKERESGALDKLWLWLLLACIGEAFEDENEICGCVVSVRKTGDKISLWTKTSSNETVTKRVGRQLKESLELIDSHVIGYQSHADCLKRNSSFNNKNRYQV